MKQIIIFLFVLLFCNVSLGKKLLIVGDPWEPWIEKVKGGRSKGIAIDRVKEIFNKIGMDYKIRIYPFKRCLKMIKDGNADAQIMVSKNVDRESYAIFPRPFLKSSYRIFSFKEKSFSWDRWEDLKKYRIGITSGFNYGAEFKEAAKKHKFKLDLVTKDHLNLSKLVVGRMGVAILDERIASKLIKENYPNLINDIVAAKKPIKNQNYYIMVSKKSPIGARFLVNKINSALE